jgi:hypothetical protein
MSLLGTTTAGTIIASVASNSGDVFTDIWPFLAFAAGIPLAFYLVKQIIGLFPKAHAKK